jgi:membrane fusion protein (multidrug efflux system)
MTEIEKTNSTKAKLRNLKHQVGKRPWLVRAIIAIVILIILWGGYSWYVQKRMAVEMSLVRPVPVMVIQVEQRVMPVMVQAFGDLRAYASANLSADSSGDIADISFEGGQKVTKDTVLVTIDNETQKANLQKAQADLELKQIDYTRNANLIKRGAVPQQELDKAKAQLAASNAEVLAALDALNKTYVKAPFDGRLGARVVSVGQYVSPGQAIVEIVDADRLKIQFSVPERYLSKLAVEQEADITTAAYPDRLFAGKVDYVAPSIDPVTRTISVEAVIENKEGLLSPGLSVQVAQVLEQNNQALVVPEEALVYSLEGPSVFIAEDDPEFELDPRVREGILEQQSAQRNIPVDELPPLQIKKVKRINVQTGTFTNGIAQITEGLTADEMVVTQGQQKLRDGAIVMIVDPAKRMEEAAAAAAH